MVYTKVTQEVERKEQREKKIRSKEERRKKWKKR
jgi:hypothetical protein